MYHNFLIHSSASGHLTDSSWDLNIVTDKKQKFLLSWTSLLFDKTDVHLDNYTNKNVKLHLCWVWSRRALEFETILGGFVLIRRAGNSSLEEMKTELRSEGTERVNLAKTAEEWKWQVWKSSVYKGLLFFFCTWECREQSRWGWMRLKTQAGVRSSRAFYVRLRTWVLIF